MRQHKRRGKHDMLVKEGREDKKGKGERGARAKTRECIERLVFVCAPSVSA